MAIPQGYSPKGETLPNNPVCKLHKSLYDLKQASRQWYAKFSAALLEEAVKFASSILGFDPVIMSNQDAWIGLEEGTATQLFSEENNIKQGSCCWSHVKKTLAKPLGTTENWITFVSWIVSISIDPLFCYVAVISDEKKFLEINITLLIFLLVIFVVLHAYKFRIYLQLELSGSLRRKQRANFILAEFITPFLANVRHLLYNVMLLQCNIWPNRTDQERDPTRWTL
ncbi:hypothetical protein EZV62_006101 [Acer yangbiense]|uniref:Reverse transcriptase Ty1/copia-type domain-containing protein n=1 Tax=Acer yangbiense TaxID=1000413 RepID=A0A5C7IRT3_9ROSI|nr:hypothetical protein EZV62_006101 [Acer yangbiense]